MSRLMYILAAALIAGVTGCGEEKTPEKIYICRCAVVQDKTVGQGQRVKDIYVFLIDGRSGNDCCSAPVLKDYSGYRDTWITEKDYDMVWRKDRSVELPAEEGRRSACEARDKVIDIADVTQQPEYLREYYPELKVTGHD